MSNWTHVAGIIRVDNFGNNLVGKINDIIGKEIHFNSSRDEWKDFDENPNSHLPCGSEGSLHMELWENPNKSAMAAYTVSIFGDLRDHDSAIDIIKWFRNKTLTLDLASCGVRNACVTANNECFGIENWVYDENTTRQFFNKDNELATLVSDDMGTSVYLEDGTTVDFDDADLNGGLNYLKDLGYII